MSVEVFEGNVSKLVATFGEGSDSVRIDEWQGQYVTSFTPEPGVHTYTVVVFFDGFEQASRNFTTR